MQTLTFYHAAICPRCRLAGRALAELVQEFADLHITRIDVTRHPFIAWKEGVRMIPCLMANGTTLSGLMLDKEQIRTFLTGLHVDESGRRT